MTRGKKGELNDELSFFVILGASVFFVVIGFTIADCNGGSSRSGAARSARPTVESPTSSTQATAPTKRASSSDIRQAVDFLASLPAACSGRHSESSSTGVVTISYTCGETRGVVKIKDGVVTEVQ